MLRLLGLSRRASAALVLGLGLSAAAAAQPADLDARLDRLGERLDLTSEQATRLDAVAASAPDATPADLWTVAADVHAVLTAEQRAALRERSGRRADGARRGRGSDGAQRGGRRGRGADGARRGGRQRGADGERSNRERPSDADREARRAQRQAHREATQPIREASRERHDALRQQLRDGSLSDAAYADAVKALRDQTRVQLRQAATPEQRARMDERDAQRDAVGAARDRVLGVTADQKAQMESRRADRARGTDVRPFLDADGRLDRRAMHQAQREQRGSRSEILTERQQEISALHRALSGGRGHGRRGRGHRR